MEPRLGHDRGIVADPCNGFQPGWCPVFPDGIPSGMVAARTPATPTARDAEYLLVGLLVRRVGHQAQSLAIALRSPATELSFDLLRYAPDIHARKHGTVRAVRNRLTLAICSDALYVTPFTARQLPRNPGPVSAAALSWTATTHFPSPARGSVRGHRLYPLRGRP